MSIAEGYLQKDSFILFKPKRYETKVVFLNNEGLAEYTAIMLNGRTEKEMNLHLIKSINQFYTNPTFIRSFAYQTIPIYLLTK